MNQHEMIKSLEEDVADLKGTINALSKLISEAHAEIAQLAPYVDQTKDLNGIMTCMKWNQMWYDKLSVDGDGDGGVVVLCIMKVVCVFLCAD